MRREYKQDGSWKKACYFSGRELTFLKLLMQGSHHNMTDQKYTIKKKSI